MDRRVKERLVGASILVALIVLIVPELLSGPAPPPAAPATPSRMPVSTPEPVRNVTVDLATSKAPTQGSVEEAASAPSGQSASGQSASGQSSAARSPEPRSQGSAAEPATLPAATLPAATLPATASRSTPQAPLESGVPPPTYGAGGAKSSAAGHAWTVQLGSFANRENADKLLHRLKGQGFTIYVSSGGAGSALRYRVRIGPLADRGTAAQTVAKLKSLGQAATIVRPGA
ncbi:MAG: SPOR domain-containing protein [Gammaproteobacteria bacterium]